MTPVPARVATTVPSESAAPPGNAAADLIAFAEKAEREVRGNILPFWLKHAPDLERGGFFGAVSHDLVASRTAPRGVLMTSRILWTFSTAYRRFGDVQYLEMARRAYEDLCTRCWDEENGGLYWTVTAEGKPVDGNKHIYGQVFGLYALSEYYRATAEPAALERAIAIYRLVEEHARDRIHGGYFEVFTPDWRRAPASASPVNTVSSKSQNTHLHVMEAYTNLLRAWPDAELRRDQLELMELMLTRIYDAKSHHLYLYLADDWAPRSEAVSYGHDIEAAWLMTEAAGVLGEPALMERTRRVAVEIAEVTLAEGIDRDGGIFNEGGPRGLSDSNKEWWPQAEAVVGFLEAYQISGDRRFLATARNGWRFIETHLVDQENGGWFHSVTREGAVRPQPRISLWKCPYHNSRACFEIMDRMAALVKAAEGSGTDGL